MNVKMDKTWTTIFYQETNPVRRMELLRENTGNGERKEEQYRNQLWIARYGKSSPVKDEFVGFKISGRGHNDRLGRKTKKAGNADY